MSRFIRAGSTPRIAGDGDQKKHISGRVRFARNGRDMQEITDFPAISESEQQKLKKIRLVGTHHDGFDLSLRISQKKSRASSASAGRWFI